jgi:DNA-binding MarR family transcriptional regulator
VLVGVRVAIFMSISAVLVNGLLIASELASGPPLIAATSRSDDNHTVIIQQINFTENCRICYCLGMARTTLNKDAAFASTLAAELRTTFGNLKRKVRQQGEQNDFTSSQIAVILRLEKDGPATVSSLARAEGMRPQSMLERAGFVAGAADPNDGRKTLISLTKVCKKWIEDGRAARQDWLTQAIQKKLSPQEQKQVSSAIHLLARLIED